MAAQSAQVAASAMDGRSAIKNSFWTAPIVGRSADAVGTCFVTCNGKTEITESVQIVPSPVFDVGIPRIRWYAYAVWSVFVEGGTPIK